MSSLDDLFARCRAEGRAALVGYLPAGFPSYDLAVEALVAMVEAGVDAVEVGMPYSDPLMEGPVIQAAHQASLEAGTRQADVLRTVEAVAATVQIQPAAAAQVSADIRRQLASYPPVRSSVPATTGGSSAPDRRYLNDWARQDKQSQDRSDAMLDQERTTSPSTGETYIVPTNAWNPSGPDGPGYYRPTPGGGSERLQAQDPATPAGE